MIKDFPDFAHLTALQDSDVEYISKANDRINAMVRDQIHLNFSRNALYSLIFILDEERQGLDSFRIVEHLKTFYAEMAKKHPETAMQVEKLLRKSEELNAKKFFFPKTEKVKPGL